MLILKSLQKYSRSTETAHFDLYTPLEQIEEFMLPKFVVTSINSYRNPVLPVEATYWWLYHTR